MPGARAPGGGHVTVQSTRIRCAPRASSRRYEEIEALYPLYRLREAGAGVEIIGSEAGATLAGKRGDEIVVERATGDLSAGDLDLLVIAGGYGPDKLRMDKGLLTLVRDLDGQGNRSGSSATEGGSRSPPASSPAAA